MPIYVGLATWTDQGTRDFRGSVQRANGFCDLSSRPAAGSGRWSGPWASTTSSPC